MKRNLQIAAIGFASAILVSLGANAQAPGGVAPAAWYRANRSLYSDAGTTPAANNVTVYQWNEAQGTGGIWFKPAPKHGRFSQMGLHCSYISTQTTGPNYQRQSIELVYEPIVILVGLPMLK